MEKMATKKTTENNKEDIVGGHPFVSTFFLTDN